MGRPRSGYVKWRDGKEGSRWYCILTLSNGKRTPWLHLPKSIARDDEAGARAAALKLGEEEREHGYVSRAEVQETFGEWFIRFHAAKEARGLATVREMRGRARKWILPGIDSKDIRAVTAEDIERIVVRLDRAVAAFMKSGPGKGRLSPSTAANVWGDLQHALDEAVRAKDPSLRVLAESPARNVRGPEGGDERQGQILFSDEIVALLSGVAIDAAKVDVPLYRRIVYAVAIYTKARSSELEALTAADVDLAHGTITISKQADAKSEGRKATKKTKTKRIRTVDIEPNVYPLVEWLVEHPQGTGGRLLHMPPPEDRAELLRKDLRTVGVTREALHIERDPLQRAIVLHDLRDTGLSHMAVRGDSPIAIQWAGGHTDFKTTQGYISRGQVEARRIGAPLPPLPPSFLEATKRLAPISHRCETGAVKYRKPLPILRPQWELNRYPGVHGMAAERLF